MGTDTPPLVAQLYILAVFITGLVCLAHFAFFARTPKKIEPDRSVPGWRLGIPEFFIGLAVIVFAVLVVQLSLSAVVAIEPNVDGRVREILLYGFAMHLTALAILLVFYKSRQEKFAEPFDRHRLGWGRSFGIALYAFLAVVPVLYPLSLGWQHILERLGIEPEQQETVMLFAQVEQLHLLLLMVFLTIIIAPLSEEILFRGCLYRFIKARVSIVVALLLSGAVFSLLHHNLLGFVPLLVLGVALAYAYEKSGSIKVPILFHGIFNLNTIILIVLSGNGV